MPARVARIGVVDRLFTRVGASDDRRAADRRSGRNDRNSRHSQTGDRTIARHPGRDSAAGRPRSTGFPLRGRQSNICTMSQRPALFATHYHADDIACRTSPRTLANVTMDVKEWQDEIVFLHKCGLALPIARTAFRWQSWPACAGGDRSRAAGARLAGEERTAVRRSGKASR